MNAIASWSRPHLIDGTPVGTVTKRISLANLSNADLRRTTRPKFEAVNLFNHSSCHLTDNDCKRVFPSIADFSASDGVMPIIKYLPHS